MIPAAPNAVQPAEAGQQFRVFHEGAWKQLTLLFRPERVPSKFSEPVWQLSGTLKAIKASTLQSLIDAGLAELVEAE